MGEAGEAELRETSGWAEGLARFAHILRHVGVRVSTAEAMDALRALQYVPLLDREQVRLALRAVMVKNRAERQVFDRVFDLYFAPPEEKAGRREQWRMEQERRAREMEEAEADLLSALEATGQSWAERSRERLRLTEEQKQTWARLPEEEKRRLRELLARAQANPVNNPADLINRIIEGSLNFWHHHLTGQERGPEPAAPAADLTGDAEVDEVIAQVAAELERDADESLLYRDMKEIGEGELARMSVLVRQLARQLVSRISRRYYRSEKRRVVDVRRTIRQNINYGGALFELRYRSRRVTRPRLVLICDVSASMAPYARFVLQFVYGLAAVVRDIESFVFSEDLERITDYFGRGRGFAATMARVMAESRQWGRATNLYRSLLTFWSGYRHLLTRSTWVLVVSDTKTLAAERAAAELGRMRGLVREIIWLNTLPKRQWREHRTPALFEKHCRMFECYTLAHLEKVLRTHIAWG
ncbi:MAG: VWA domain-containing protein [Firmicutes bacterium]|nr:VWA domain-containing protein [Bacillota bacterium]